MYIMSVVGQNAFRKNVNFISPFSLFLSKSDYVRQDLIYTAFSEGFEVIIQDLNQSRWMEFTMFSLPGNGHIKANLSVLHGTQRYTQHYTTI